MRRDFISTPQRWPVWLHKGRDTSTVISQIAVEADLTLYSSERTNEQSNWPDNLGLHECGLETQLESFRRKSYNLSHTPVVPCWKKNNTNSFLFLFSFTNTIMNNSVYLPLKPLHFPLCGLFLDLMAFLWLHLITGHLSYSHYNH